MHNAKVTSFSVQLASALLHVHRAFVSTTALLIALFIFSQSTESIGCAALFELILPLASKTTPATQANEFRFGPAHL